jgi:hypothetical protein
VTNDFIDEDWLREQGWNERGQELPYGDWHLEIQEGSYILWWLFCGTMAHYKDNRMQVIGEGIHSRHDLLYVVELAKARLVSKQLLPSYTPF